MTCVNTVKNSKKSNELLRNNDYADNINHNKFNSENNSTIPRCKFNNTSYGPHSSAQSTCSRHLKTHTFQCLCQNGSGSQEMESSTRINRKRSIDTKVSFREPSDKELCDDIHRTIYEKNCFDKSTYCRPVVNLYNEQFLYKTIEKNTRLNKLVRELMIARQREKETENWNNYINDLRRKHCNDTKMRRASSLQYFPESSITPETIEDCYNTKFIWKQSNPCQNLLQDLYNIHENVYLRQPYDEYYKTRNEYDPKPTKSYIPFETNQFCYPTSSQGRLIMLERERQKLLAKQRFKQYCNTINEGDKQSNSRKCAIVLNSRGTNTMLETTSTQTKFHTSLHTNIDVELKKVPQTVSKKICTDEIYKLKKLQECGQSTETVWKQNSLACIEKKLDNLIHSINNFIAEMKTKNYAQLKQFDMPTKLKKENVNITKSDSYGIAKKEKKVCGLGDNSSQDSTYSSNISFDRVKRMDENISKINKILLNEVNRNKLSTFKDSCVGDAYYPCSVQISVTIPTKEISTEVTRSLSKAKYNSGNNIHVIEEINPPTKDNRQIAIAVNTDPVSLLALLRLTTEETLRRLLSYVPCIDYYYFLSRLQRPQSRAIESHFVCNICGAAFMRPSQLTDHIEKHELGRSRDCCVCRHVLDLPRRRSGLFKCRYCGQRFTRAYCCELHQQSCAKRLGVPHDITSSLMLLT